MMEQIKIISIDHGNQNIKTLNHVFTAGYMECGHLPSIGGDILAYGDKEYALVDQRLPHKKDKSIDEDYFILTLYAIGKELSTANKTQTVDSRDKCWNVELLVGLPPLQFKTMKQRFIAYFMKRKFPIEFALNGIPITIKISAVHVYPQAYAAFVTVMEKFMDVRTLNIVDVGGHTVDILQMVNLCPNMAVCTTLFGGVNTLFQRINESTRAKGDKDITDSVMEGVLRCDKKVLNECSQELISLIQSKAEQFAREMIVEISQVGLDLREHKTLFIGGGAILLMKHIESTGLIAKQYYVTDVQANSKGYVILHERQTGNRN